MQFVGNFNHGSHERVMALLMRTTGICNVGIHICIYTYVHLNVCICMYTLENYVYTFPSLKFRRFCVLLQRRLRSTNKLIFIGLASGEIIRWNKLILINCSRTEYSARSRREGVYAKRGLGTLIAPKAAVRRTSRSLQYTYCVYINKTCVRKYLKVEFCAYILEHICICLFRLEYVCMYIYMYIYIYTEREEYV